MELSQLREHLKDAMRAKDQLKVDTLRGVLSAFTNELVAKGRKPTEELSDDEMLAVLKRLAKQRKDSIEQFEKGGRGDLVASEEAELKILEEYLPAQMSEEEVTAAVKAIIEQVGAAGPQDLGKVMGVASKQLAGKAAGNVISTVAKNLLTA